MDETETVLYVCETMTLEDLIYMTLEDLILSHVSIYVCVVSLITKLFSVNFSLFAYLSLYASVRIKLFPKWWTIVCNEEHLI